MNYGLLYTFLTGLFLLLGAFVILMINDNKRIKHFSIGVAFTVMIGLSVFDLIPEEYEIFKGQFNTFYLILLIACCALVGFGILKLLDRFIPDHHGNETEENHMLHVGIVSTIAILIHNIIEGMALYTSSNISTTTGLMLMIGIGVHNIPMGMIIASTLKSKSKRILSLTVLSLSTFIGGLVLFILGDIHYSIQGVLLGVTAGMLFYISLMELLPIIVEDKEDINIKLGIAVGVLLLLIALCI